MFWLFDVKKSMVLLFFRFNNVSYCGATRRIAVGAKSGTLALYELRASKSQVGLRKNGADDMTTAAIMLLWPLDAKSFIGFNIKLFVEGWQVIKKEDKE